jgi:acyl dehydratase
MNVLPEADDIHGYYCKDLSVGMTASCAATDFVLFAGISGYVDPVHLNEKFATKTMFEGRITHGMLTANFISTVLAAYTHDRVCASSPRSIQTTQRVRNSRLQTYPQRINASTRIRAATWAKHRLSRGRQPYSCRNVARRMRPE